MDDLQLHLVLCDPAFRHSHLRRSTNFIICAVSLKFESLSENHCLPDYPFLLGLVTVPLLHQAH